MVVDSGAGALVACGTARCGGPLTGEHTPPTPEIALGQKVFDASCHQLHVGGKQAIGLALSNKPLPGRFIKLQVRNSVGKMPSFFEEEISDGELDALVEHMVWLRGLHWKEEPRSEARSRRRGHMVAQRLLPGGAMKLSRIPRRAGFSPDGNRRRDGRGRLSGLLPVQCAYADFHGIDALWSDARPEELLDSLCWFQEQDLTLGG